MVCHISEFTKRTLLVFAGGFLMLLSHRNAYADYAILTDQQLKGGLNYSPSETADLKDHILQTPQSHLKYIRTYWYDLYIGSCYTYKVPADGQQCNIIMYSDNMYQLTLNDTYTIWMDNEGYYDTAETQEWDVDSNQVIIKT
jgi:hypothetical protein